MNENGLAIAVVGMAARFPNCTTIKDYWRLLINGYDGITTFTEVAGKKKMSINKSSAIEYYIPRKGIFSDPFHFDHEFFNIPLKDARIMDPQVRCFLEICYHALEDSGYTPADYNGMIGIYAGSSSNFSWLKPFLIDGRPPAEVLQLASLNDPSFCTRLSYKLNLKGPSVTVQTACSTSLVAVHLACQALLAGECNLALAGGVSITHPYKSGYYYQEGVIQSSDGRCRPFDEKANGTLFSNGVGAIVLKRYNEALVDNDHIYAVIKGSCVNNDGSEKVGYTAPGVLGQEHVIRLSHQLSEISSESITYVETHGTGTYLGDPTEIEAMKRAFSTSKRQYCAIGSVKGNIGHLDAASGIASLIKTILCLKYETLVPSLHFKKSNAKIDFSKTPFYVNTQTKKWENKDQEPLTAGVSSFGIGGTNAHVVLTKAPARKVNQMRKAESELIILSAKNEVALNEIKNQLIRFIESNSTVNLADLAYTLYTGRERFKIQKVYKTDSVENLIDCLKHDRILDIDQHELSRHFAKKKPNSFIGRVSLPGYPFQRIYCYPEKLSLSSLPDLDEQKFKKANGDLNEVKDQKTLKERLVRIFTSYFEKQFISSDQPFFEIGATSLDIAQLHSKINSELNTSFSIESLYSYSTIDALCDFLLKKVETPAKPVTQKLESICAQPIKAEAIPPDQGGFAVIGIACRFPGAGNVNQFWKNLCEGKESISFFSKNELFNEGIPIHQIEGKNYIRAKGIIDYPESFDYAFFGYTKREAQLMDPQYRIMHECAFAALEDAGYANSDNRAVTGIFAGSGSNYQWVAGLQKGIIDTTEQFSAGLLNDREFLTTRLAYKLDLCGPAVTVQSACSTSALSIVIACQNLLTKQCDMALAGGVSINFPAKSGYYFQDGMVNSKDGHCRPFDQKASGTVFSDGIGMIVLKRYADAIKDNDSIYAIIKGYGINNDGSGKVGYSAPSEKGQTACIRSSLEMAGIEPNSIEFHETHGTGTQMGDRIEWRSILDTLNKGEAPCAIGTVKANIGHLNTASGIAGFIKSILVLHHKTIPPVINLEQLKQGIEKNTRFYFNKRLKPWKPGDIPRRASVSSFGIGGTNVHFTLEEAQENWDTLSHKESEMIYDGLLCLSANSPTSLLKLKNHLGQYLVKYPEEDLSDVCATLMMGRKYLPFRYAKSFISKKQLIADLSAVDSGNLLTQNMESKRIVFMFPGQGAQYVGMAKGLYDRFTRFRHILGDVCKLLKDQTKVDIFTIIYPDEKNKNEAVDRLRQTELTQVAIFVISYSIASFLIELGVKPDVMIGHSIGEYVAACISGALTIKNALILIANRGQLIQQLDKGDMLSVALPGNQLSDYIDDAVTLAADNMERSSVLSGDSQAILTVKERLEAKGVQTQLLHTSHAFHSQMMTPAVKPFKKICDSISFGNVEIPYISNVTGEYIDENQLNGDYWASHLLGTVRFREGIELLLTEDLFTIFLEIGPGRTLSSFVQNIGRNFSNKSVRSSLRHPLEEISDTTHFYSLLGNLWEQNISINWQILHDNRKIKRLHLPEYPFELIEHGVSRKSKIQEKNSSTVKKRNTADWFYQPLWVQSVESCAGEPEKMEKLLVFCNDDAFSEALLMYLNNSEVFTVFPDEVGFNAKIDSFTVNPVNEKDFDKLFARLDKMNWAPDQIIHTWNIGPNNKEEQSLKAIENNIKKSWFGVLLLSKAYIKKKIRNKSCPLKIFGNAIVSGDQHTQRLPFQAVLMGQTIVIAQEISSLQPRLIQLDGKLSENHQIASDVYDEISIFCSDPIIRRQKKVRRQLSYHPVKDQHGSEHKSLLRENGVYLITGGLGNIGLLIAEYLCSKWSAKVILCGRSALPEKKEWKKKRGHKTIDRLLSIEKGNGSIHYFQGDVGDMSQMQKNWLLANQNFGNINGVICAAGVTQGDSFQGIDHIQPGHCENQISTKIRSLLIFDRLIKKQSPDFCLLCSSIAAQLGGLSFSAYASVNAFADQFAAYASKRSKTQWISINWDSWVFEHDQSRETHNIGQSISQAAILPDEGIAFFEQVLRRQNQPQHICATNNFEIRLEQWVGCHFQDKIENNSVHKTIHKFDDLLLLVGDIWKDYLREDHLEPDDNLFELGASSLDVIQVAKRLSKSLNQDISVVDMFSYPSIKTFCAYLKDDMPSIENLSVSASEEQIEQQVMEGENKALKADISLQKDHLDNYVAIVGMAGKFPGADTIAQFYSNLSNGVESITHFSREDILSEDILVSLIDHPNYVRAKGIIKGAHFFDADFFGYTPAEAKLMDPQGRIFHQIVWNALEDACIVPETYKGRIGLFAGVSGNLQWLTQKMIKSAGPSAQYHAMTLADKDYLATLISYKLNLTGPSLMISTACSSSLVAVHKALQSLLDNECDAAVAGGVSISLPIKSGYLYEEGMIHSKDGRCKAFDIKASGTVFGDGGGVVVLKRLSDALKMNDDVYAVIIGSAINNDGNLKAGFTAPSPQGQEKVIRNALKNAKVSPESVSYVEAHGTGTILGDPIEIKSLARAYATDKRQFCYIGSVKTNIGHLNHAAGIAGLIKAVLSVKNKTLLPSLHFTRPNNRIDFENTPFKICNTYKPWPEDRPFVSGISSFGIGGTNVHIIIDRHESREKKTLELQRRQYPFFLSAHTETALHKMVQCLITYLKGKTDASLQDISYTLAIGRKIFEKGISLSANSIDELISGLKHYLMRKRKWLELESKPAKAGFLFLGGNASAFSLVKTFCETESLFKEFVTEAIDVLQKVQPNHSLTINRFETGSVDSIDLSNTELIQFIFDYSMARLLMSWNILPDIIIGRHTGEFAAAVVSGILPLEKAINYIAQQDQVDHGQLHRTFCLANVQTNIQRFESKPACIPCLLYDSQKKINANGIWQSVQSDLGLGEKFLPYMRSENNSNKTNRFWICFGSKDSRTLGMESWFRKFSFCRCYLMMDQGKIVGSEDSALMKMIADLALGGIPIDWEKFYEKQVLKRMHLPGYVFDEKKYSLDISNVQKLVSSIQPIKIRQAVENTQLSGTIKPPNNASAKLSVEVENKKPRERDMTFQLRRIWKDILGINAFSDDDSFYELGGNSLTAVKLVERAKKEGIPLDMKMLLENETITGLSKSVAFKLGLNSEPDEAKWQFNESFYPEQYPSYVSCMYTAIREKLKYEQKGCLESPVMFSADGNMLIGLAYKTDAWNKYRITSEQLHFGELAEFPSLQQVFGFSYRTNYFQNADDELDYCIRKLRSGEVVIVTGSDYFLPYSPTVGMPPDMWRNRNEITKADLSMETILHAFVLVGQSSNGFQIFDGSFNYFGELSSDEFIKTIGGFSVLPFMKGHPLYEHSKPFQVIEIESNGWNVPDESLLYSDTINRWVRAIQSDTIKKKSPVRPLKPLLKFAVGMNAIKLFRQLLPDLNEKEIEDMPELITQWKNKMLISIDLILYGQKKLYLDNGKAIVDQLNFAAAGINELESVFRSAEKKNFNLKKAEFALSKIDTGVSNFTHSLLKTKLCQDWI